MTTGPSAGSARLPALGRQAAQQVARELSKASAAMRTGDLHVSGDPGGRLRVVRGRVLAVSTAGAPGVGVLLARPGRKKPGEAERRALEAMATLDGAFAIAAGWIDGSFWTAGIEMDPADLDDTGPSDGFAGVEADRLTAETERRLRALANSRVSPHRHRLARTGHGDALLHDCPAGARREILLQVDGQHRCRDIAFAVGRGLYPVTVEVSRLLAERALVVPGPNGVAFAIPEPGASAGVPAPGASAVVPASGATAVVPASGASVVVPASGVPAVVPAPVPLRRGTLPRRRRNASGINELYPPRAQEFPASARGARQPENRRIGGRQKGCDEHTE
ncbi:hypothetical protein BJY24_001420 [Nocardia transvalensis]|uniref:Uncharacterized protein n=1 Tax=Nocardia transvalensis TaxID=37333 RepID=A0A7W9PB90_9NOCA|nr:hypothetical protein [Nocardia transvalensis]MBB5912553.1 hypothetical protein [Nocardia transvalensis]